MLLLFFPFFFVFLTGTVFGIIGRKYVVYKVNRKRRKEISLRAYFVEFAVALLFTFLYMFIGFSASFFIFYIYTFLLFLTAVIDYLIFEIPAELNLFIFFLGMIHIISDRSNALNYLIGFFLSGLILYLIHFFTKGRAIGGGDVKFVAVSSLILGLEGSFYGFFIGCVLALVFESVKRILFKTKGLFALGPYLALGYFIILILKQLLFF